MAGGGFMKHAQDTNGRDRAQKRARRETFNGNHSEKMVLGDAKRNTMQFGGLTDDQIAAERNRIAERSKRRKRLRAISLLVSLIVTAVIFVYLVQRFT